MKSVDRRLTRSWTGWTRLGIILVCTKSMNVVKQWKQSKKHWEEQVKLVEQAVYRMGTDSTNDGNKMWSYWNSSDVMKTDSINNGNSMRNYWKSNENWHYKQWKQNVKQLEQLVKSREETVIQWEQTEGIRTSGKVMRTDVKSNENKVSSYWNSQWSH